MTASPTGQPAGSSQHSKSHSHTPCSLFLFPKPNPSSIYSNQKITTSLNSLHFLLSLSTTTFYLPLPTILCSDSTIFPLSSPLLSILHPLRPSHSPTRSFCWQSGIPRRGRAGRSSGRRAILCTAESGGGTPTNGCVR